jgi:hypothetical protein
MVATRLSSPKSRHEVPRTQRTSFAICDLLFAVANDPQASSSSSCRTACLPHLMNGSRSGMPRERKNRSQAKEMLWIVTFGFDLVRLRNVFVLLVWRIRQISPLLKRTLRGREVSRK